MHVVINPTWRCQLHCEHCWLPYTAINRLTTERRWSDWGSALVNALPQGAIVDVSGGEPLLYPSLVNLLAMLGAARINWAITTNGMALDVIDALCLRRPAGGVVINVSCHADAPWEEAVRRLRGAGFPVNINRVAGADVDPGQPHAVLPYQDWARNTARDGKWRYCNAGENHWIAAPDGNLWRCMVAMQVGLPPTGNLFAGTLSYTAQQLSGGKHLCAIGCSTCYREFPEAWGISMEAVP